LEIAFGVVDADRPEAVDRNVLDLEFVDGLAVVLFGRDAEISRILVRIAALARCCGDQMPHRIDLALRAEGIFEATSELRETSTPAR
jgi:hypothetical protein